MKANDRGRGNAQSADGIPYANCLDLDLVHAICIFVCVPCEAILHPISITSGEEVLQRDIPWQAISHTVISDPSPI